MLSSAWITSVQWIVIVLLVVVVLTAVLSFSIHAGLAVAQDGLPYLLVLAWVILVLAVVDRAWILAAAAACLVVFHLFLIIPRFLTARKPHWAIDAPRIRLVVSNVFTENPTPELLAASLLAADGDVMIITEWNPKFAAAFEAAGGNESHPHRLVDDDDHSEYAVCVVSKIPLDAKSAIIEIEQLKLTHAVLPCGARNVQVIGIIPNAVVDPGGFPIWKSQIASLIAHVPSLDKPIVLAGDFNTTRFRPEFRALLKAGLVDAHDALGRGLTSSFRLSTKGILASPGTVVRLDHALLSKEVCAIDAHDLESCGSDHLPFVMTIAVRQHRKPRRDHFRTKPPS